MIAKKLTQERLVELLHYNPEAGTFTWKENPRYGIEIGDVAGYKDSNGYIIIGVDGKQHKASRLAFLYMKGYFPEHEVDHINRVKDDNQWINLRHVSHSCNLRNTKMFSNNKSGVKGVGWNKKNNKWIAYISVNNRFIYLGIFSAFIEAVKARYRAEKKHKWHICGNRSSAYRYLKRKDGF